MKGWREHAADIFTKHGIIAAKMKSALGPGPLDYWDNGHLARCEWKSGKVEKWKGA